MWVYTVCSSLFVQKLCNKKFICITCISVGYDLLCSAGNLLCILFGTVCALFLCIIFCSLDFSERCLKVR